MSKMSELYTEYELDFERLSITSMKWDEATWGEQCEDDRFEGVITFEHCYIYWFEDYAYLMGARYILKEFDIEYQAIYDTATDQWALTTTYESIEWRCR